MKGKIFTLAEIRSAYTEDKINEDREAHWLYFVIRKISFYPTYLFMRLGISAGQATFSSLIIGVLGCIFLALGNRIIEILGAVLLNLWIVLDCVDGNIARSNWSSNRYGEFIDTLSGYIIYIFLFISVGIAAFRHSNMFLEKAKYIDSMVWIILGMGNSLVIILSRLIFQKFANLFSDCKQVKQRLKGESGLRKLFFRIGHNLISSSGFLLPILFLAVMFNLLNAFLVSYIILNTMALFATIYRTTVESKRLTVDKS